MIYVNNEYKEFHLQTLDTSYIIRVTDQGHLENLHYGRKIMHRDNFNHLVQRFGTALGNSTAYSTKDDSYILDSIKLEISTYGKGDYRELSTMMKFTNGTRTCDLLFDSFRIIEGKQPLEGLPCTFGESDEVSTLEITLKDPISKFAAKLCYSVFEHTNVISRSMVLINEGQDTLVLDKAMSMNLDLNSRDYDVVTLSGKWISECQIQRNKLKNGTFHVDSKKGTSSSKYNPFLCLASPNTNEHSGDCYGVSLVYSGNHEELVELTPHGFVRIQAGINHHDFGWYLQPGEQFQTPEALLTFSHHGFHGMSRGFHGIIRKNLISKEWQNRERPILINNWEATYFDFNEKKLLKLAKEAKEMGMELFVLDDGWFGKRNDDKSSLGDWFENLEKLPNGLEGLSRKINEIGMDFGLWVEPEMISVESQLYQAHPDWAIKNPDRTPSFGRNQLVLDLTNPEVVDYLDTTLSGIFEKANVHYVKWDMNRNFSDQYSNHLAADRQCEMNHRYVLGLYELLGRLKSKFPEVLFESCSSGGNRFDLGMLYYMPQTWTSDDTDAVERYGIQYGTSMVYPPSTMGAHVSGAPSHQVMRRTPIETRFNVAAFGLLGYELDLTKLSDFDKKVIKKQIEYYKQHRKLLQFGDFYRLESPFDGNRCAWMMVLEDQSEAMLGYYQKLQQASPILETIRLVGLEEGAAYELTNRQQYVNIRTFGELINDFIPVNIRDGGMLHSVISDHYMFEQEKYKSIAGGDELMYAGFKQMSQFIGTGYNDNIGFIGDFGSRLYHLHKISK